LIDVNCFIFSHIHNEENYLEKNLNIAKKAFEQGVQTIIATSSVTENEDKSLERKINVLKERMKKEEINLQMIVEPLVTIDHTYRNKRNRNSNHMENRNLFIYLSSYEMPLHLTETLFNYQINGNRIILSSPETYPFFLINPEELYSLAKKGILIQLSAASIAGKNGWRAKRLATELIKRNMAHFVGSNAQSEQGLLLDKAYNFINKYYGREYTDYFQKNAKTITVYKN